MTKRTIACLAGSRIDSESDVAVLQFEEVIQTKGNNFDWLPAEAEPLIPKCWHIRQDPRLVKTQLLLDSYEEAIRELSVLRPGTLVAEVTTRAEGRDLRLLQKVADKLKEKQIYITYAASVLDMNSTEDAMIAELKRELVDTRDYDPPTFISLRISASAQECNQKLLSAARTVSQGKVLVFISLPAYARLKELRTAASFVRDSLGPETPCMIRSANRCSNFVQTLLGETPHDNHFGLIDGWARPLEPAVWYRPERQDPADEPNDLLRIAELAHASSSSSLFKNTLLISDGIRHKLQLRAHGGFGYGYALSLIEHHHEIFKNNDLLLGDGLRKNHPPSPQGRSMDADDVALNSKTPPQRGTQLFKNARLLFLLSNSIIPAPVEVTVPVVHCSLCNAAFPVALSDRYAKYDNIYCSRSCLDQHRGLKFVDSALRGPVASAQLYIT